MAVSLHQAREMASGCGLKLSDVIMQYLPPAIWVSNVRLDPEVPLRKGQERLEVHRLHRAVIERQAQHHSRRPIPPS